MRGAYPVRLHDVALSRRVIYNFTSVQTDEERKPGRSRSPATGRSTERVVTNRIIAGIVGSNETARSHTACAVTERCVSLSRLVLVPWERKEIKIAFPKCACVHTDTYIRAYAFTNMRTAVYKHTVTYSGFAWQIRLVLDLMIEFIGSLYNWLQQFTNHYLDWTLSTSDHTSLLHYSVILHPVSWLWPFLSPRHGHHGKHCILLSRMRVYLSVT
jgi:hypothetical protein